MPSGVHLSIQIKRQIVERFRNGDRQSKIAADLNLNKSIVSRTISNFNRSNTLEAVPKSGRKRKTNGAADLKIKMLAVRDPFISASRIKGELPEVGVSVSTIKRRLKEAGLCGKKSAKKPCAYTKNRSAKLLVAGKHKDCVDKLMKLMEKDGA